MNEYEHLEEKRLFENSCKFFVLLLSFAPMQQLVTISLVVSTSPTAQLAEEIGQMLYKQLQCSVPGQLKSPLLLLAVSYKCTEKRRYECARAMSACCQVVRGSSGISCQSYKLLLSVCVSVPLGLLSGS